MYMIKDEVDCSHMQWSHVDDDSDQNLDLYT